MLHSRSRAAFAATLWLAACGGGANVTPDPCAAMTCTTPPADSCPSAASALHHQATGSCAVLGGAATCDYRPALVDCAAAGQVCDAGACVLPPDPCAASGLCVTPPAAGCQSATVAVTYPAEGVCTPSGGQPSCAYPPIAVDCGLGGQVCDAGACVAPDPCAAGGVCTSPPAATCASPTAALVYPATGTCSTVSGAASCQYPPTTLDCAAQGQRCDGGACVDPPPDPCAAAGVCSSPPPAGCASVTILLTYPSPGACTAASGTATCDYQPVQVDCAAAGRLCAGGACVADPCAIPPDGAGFLAYASWTDASNGYDLRAVRTDGTCDQPLASGPGDDLSPSWSAAAGRVAWGGNRGGNGRVLVMNLSDRVQRVLDTGADLATAPALSPDGSAVVYENLAYGSWQSDLRSAPVAGGAPTPLFASATEIEAGPAFSPSGAELYFIVRDSQYRPSLCRGPAAGGARTTIISTTFGATLLGKPAVSADGAWLVYARSSTTPGSLSKVVKRNLSTGVECVLSDQGDSEPALPASGSFVAVRRGSTEIVLLGLDSTDCVRGNAPVLRRLTDGTRLVGTPAFPR